MKPWMRFVIGLSLAAALAGYLFWTTGEDGPTGPEPFVSLPVEWQELVVLGRGLEQHLDGDDLVINGFPRLVDRRRLGRLERRFRRLRLPPESQRAAVAPTALAAYGLSLDPAQMPDGAGLVRVDGEPLLAWGRHQQQVYCYDPASRRLAAVPAASVGLLVEMTERLDEPVLIADADDWHRLQIDGATWRYDEDSRDWHDPMHPAAAPGDERIRRLQGLVGRIELLDWQGAEQLADTDGHRLQVTTDAGSDWHLRFGGDATGGWAATPGQPPQHITAGLWTELDAVVTDLQEERLFDLQLPGTEALIERVVVERQGTEWFRLERRGAGDREHGHSSWSLLQDDLIFDAEATIGRQFERAFAEIAVQDSAWLAGADAPVVPTVPDWRVTISGDDYQAGAALTVAAQGDRLFSDVRSGLIVEVPPLLAGLHPDRCLSPVLIGVDPRRVVKIQWAEGRETAERAMILDRPDGGSWRMRELEGVGLEQWRAETVTPDPFAVERLVRAVAGMRAEDVRLATDTDRARGTHASLTVRIAPIADQTSAASDPLDLRDTLEIDKAWYVLSAAFRQQDETPVWLRDGDGLLMYRLSHEQVDLLWSSRVEPLLPLVPSVVMAVHWRPADPTAATVRLWRTTEGWRLRHGEGATWPADDRVVERFLLRLAGLEARQTDNEAAPVQITEAGCPGLLTIEVLGRGEKTERWELTMAVQDEQTWLSVLIPGIEHAGRYQVVPAVADWLWPAPRSWLAADLLRQGGEP